MNNEINLSGLIPHLSDIGFPIKTAEQLSATYIALLIIICLFFLIWSVIATYLSSRRVSWLIKLLKNESSTSVASNRYDLLDQSNQKNNQAAHLWKEFDESLIDIPHDDTTRLFNTIDANHFFNTSTLASEITESRMLAAVPAFLTALGVIGTFIGLQLGLSELNIGNEAAVSEMKAGLAYVISGAKIAFMTSVWGVGLSLVYNFFEKGMAGLIRWRINCLQIIVDKLFPRLSAEFQLQRIADDGYQSRETLQGLAEKIGEKMQESLLTATTGIQEGLESSLEKIMAPAINKLVDETSDGNQKALESLLQSFLDKFGELGGQQKNAMEIASQQVNDSLQSLGVTMSSFIEKLDTSQENSAEREQELIVKISDQVDQLVGNSNKQNKLMSDFVKEQLDGLSKIFVERDSERQSMFVKQSEEIKTSTEELLKRLETGMQGNLEASNALILQGEKLQDNIENSVQASVEATSNLKSSAYYLKTASNEMSLFGSNIKQANDKLSGTIKEAVESTSDLAKNNKETSNLMNQQLQGILTAEERMKDLIESANTAFDKMRGHQVVFLEDLEERVNKLSSKMTQLLEDYANRANTQTARHLDAWSQHTTGYASAMTNVAQSLSNVVDEIEVKLGN